MDKLFDITITYQRGYHQFQSGNASHSTTNFKRLLKIDPNALGAYYELANISVQQKNYPKAERLFKKTITMHPNFIDGYFNWGICLARQRKFDQASQLFLKVLELDPNDLQALFELGTILADQFKYQRAVQIFERIIQIDPMFFPVYSHYGQALFYIGEYERAIEELFRVLAVQPKDWIANNTLGLIFLIQQKYEEARTFGEAVVEQNKAYTLAWMNLSMVLLQEGKEEEAVEMFNKGMGFMNERNNPNGRERLVEIYRHIWESLEKKALDEKTGGEDKECLGKTMESIKFVLGLLENYREEKGKEEITK